MAKQIRRAHPTVALDGATTTPTGGYEKFDPEIRDMASYVHNYKVDSDLAVSLGRQA